MEQGALLSYNKKLQRGSSEKVNKIKILKKKIKRKSNAIILLKIVKYEKKHLAIVKRISFRSLISLNSGNQCIKFVCLFSGLWL